jgi:hypothetical protein
MAASFLLVPPATRHAAISISDFGSKAAVLMLLTVETSG